MQTRELAILLICSPLGEVQSIPETIADVCEICGTDVGMDGRLIKTLNCVKILPICRECEEIMERKSGFRPDWRLTTPDGISRAVNARNN